MKNRTFSVHLMAALLLSFLFLLPAGTVLSFAENADSTQDYIVDQAGVLSDTEREDLNTRLQEFRDANQFDLVIVTTTGLDPDDRQDYADDFYDYNGYGYGADRDGILLLVNINADGTYESGNSWISTCGSGITIFSYDTIQEMGQVLTPYLLACNYSTAFQQFITLAKAQYNSGSYGDAWEDDDWADNWNDSWADSWNEDQSFSVGSSGWDVRVIVIAALVVGVMGTVVVVLILKRQMISVRPARDAGRYVVDDSLRLRSSHDIFLYSHVTQTRRPQQTDNSGPGGGGGGGIHTSSSGSHHGGGGF